MGCINYHEDKDLSQFNDNGVGPHPQIPLLASRNIRRTLAVKQ